MALLLASLRAAGAGEQAAVLLARDPAAHVTLDDPYGVASLLDALREAGADGQAAVLLARDPAAHVALDDPRDVATLLGGLREAGADEQAAALAARLPGGGHVRAVPLGGKAARISSGSAGSLMAPRLRHGAGTTSIDGLSLSRRRAGKG